MQLVQMKTHDKCTGANGPQGIKLLKQIGTEIWEATGEKLSNFSFTKYLNGNTTSVLWVVPQHREAQTAYLIFVYKKQKCYNEKI